MTNIFKIVNKTNLHAGSGDSNFGVIDRLIQRDPTDNLPCIYASSLKGAFREYWDEGKNAKSEANHIFGKDDKGAIIFHQAHLISIPLRSNKQPYFNVTALMAIENLIYTLALNSEKNGSLIDKLNKLKAPTSGKINVYNNYMAGLKIEDYSKEFVVDCKTEYDADIASLLGPNYCMVSNDNYIKLCSDFNLPVIARNNLENGQSKNLWYEQILPRESRLFFAVTNTPLIDEKKIDAVKGFYNEFKEAKYLQIGANATIGYGQCLISKLN